MLKFKIKKKFIDSDRKEYKTGDTIELDEINKRIKIDRMVVYGIIGCKPIGVAISNLKKAVNDLGKIIEKKKRGRPRRPEIERAVIL